ncbi:hypothetical protein CHARACLAT_015214 [Characodon lateralis]|uniref:Uncharacterized protein n=1 Tax=Characodon lateralis TaxID=208331 RepID=A0ABU7F475_9TELE|nr:hypothetical protein [Characodon lateralis]
MTAGVRHQPPAPLEGVSGFRKYPTDRQVESCCVLLPWRLKLRSQNWVTPNLKHSSCNLENQQDLLTVLICNQKLQGETLLPVRDGLNAEDKFRCNVHVQ